MLMTGPARQGRRPTSLPMAAILASLVLASCSIMPGSNPGAGGSTTSLLGGAALNAVQADFFANRYSLAEAGYRKYLNERPSDSTGHAEYGLFLAYNHRFVEALAQAQAAVDLAPNSAIAAAVQTRIQDC